jgi:cysteine desulfurase
MEKAPIYLDHNATTPCLPQVVEAMTEHLAGEGFGNPSSNHPYGKRAKAAVEKARAQVAGLIGADPSEIVFTSGGTEANNLAIRGVLRRSLRNDLVTSTFEHPATAVPADRLQAAGHQVRRVDVGGGGLVITDAFEASLDDQVGVVSVIAAHNEVGTLQDLALLARLTHRAGAFFHADAAQWVGKVPIDVKALDVDLLSIAGHKLYAPKGVGALYIKKGVELDPILLGAGQERGIRPGTENVASIVGLGQAAALAFQHLPESMDAMARRRDRLYALMEKGVPGLRLFGHPDRRLPNTLNVGFPGVKGSDVLGHCPRVAASTGSACHDGADSPSASLLAMGVEPEVAMGTVRLSLGRGTDDGDVEEAAAALIQAYEKTLAS